MHLPALSAVLFAAGLSGCSAVSQDGSLLGLVTPYRIDIVQGNVVTKEQLALVRPGLTRVQVRDLLGSPLLADPFHADRWDYVFTIVRPGTQPQRRSVVVYFEGDRLAKIDAPDLPSEREFVALISRTSARPWATAPTCSARSTSTTAAGCGTRTSSPTTSSWTAAPPISWTSGWSRRSAAA